MLVAGVSAHANVSYFYGDGCHYCAKVEASGIIEKVNRIDEVNVEKFEIYFDDRGRQKYLNYANQLEISQYDRGVPFVVIECEGSFFYIIGTSIIDKLEEVVVTCEGNGVLGDGVSSQNPYMDEITLGGLVMAALIDSINPCAFGVLIFLMLSLLNMGSAKRALKAGLIYTFVVFVVYFLSGFGIFKIIQSFTSITHYVYIFAGVLVLALGLWQFKDVFFPKVGPTLQISSKAKPIMEKIIRKGTIPAMILLGVTVSLFELPCTGGIYLGILTLMSINKTFAVSYLLLYNLIFVLPLIILTFMIYKGMSPKILQSWTSRQKNWMKIGAGGVLIALGLYILLF